MDCYFPYPLNIIILINGLKFRDLIRERACKYGIMNNSES